jgi:hypothetical protein
MVRVSRDTDYPYWCCQIWDITPCSLLKVNRGFGGTCRLNFQGWRMSRTSPICYIPEDRALLTGYPWFSSTPLGKWRDMTFIQLSDAMACRSSLRLGVLTVPLKELQITMQWRLLERIRVSVWSWRAKFQRRSPPPSSWLDVMRAVSRAWDVLLPRKWVGSRKIARRVYYYLGTCEVTVLRFKAQVHLSIL